MAAALPLAHTAWPGGAGAGLPDAYRPGVGIASMRERAEELGGACRLERRPEGGTRVSARLPLR